MREKLNDNPMAQLALIGLLLVAGVFILLKPGGGGEESEEASSSGEVTATAGVEEPTAAVGAGSGEVPTSIPVAPPPQRFTAAYDSGKTVVLLVVNDGGIDDAYTARASLALTGLSETALIVVPVAQIARYAAVTVGLDLSQVPALVIVRPKHLSHGVQQATVTYGYQTRASVVQAVRDASYKGPEATYHPN
ncbi:MAG TPA: hypothetical protein VLL27_06270 [Solirubrobacterales bacterium]|nr:hypothetical protein [Solirubrobacterales bacterium]